MGDDLLQRRYINDGEEQTTAEISVSGLVAGDRIVVCATSTQNCYLNSNWSEEKTQLPILSAPVVDTTLFNSEGTISWAEVEGADYYYCEIDGMLKYVSDLSYSGIAVNSTVRVHAVCVCGQYERNGAWSEYFTREDT